MILDIRRTVYKKKIQSLFTSIIFVLIITILIFKFYGTLFSLDRYEISLILAAIYVLYIVYNTLRGYNYIYYSDEGNKIILRYFSLSVFEHKKNSIEIPKSNFGGYKVEKKWLGFREVLILMVKTKKGLARYPSVSITALSKNEKKGLYTSLNRARS